MAAAVPALWRRAVSIVQTARHNVPRTWFAIFVVASLLICLRNSQLISLFDAGLYHFQSIGWHREYGVVFGKALIHFRLGFESAWYSLTAGMEPSPLSGRMGGVLNALILSSGLAYSFVALNRVFHRSARARDVFWLAFYSIIVCASPHEASTTAADLGAAFLIGASCWSLMGQESGSTRFRLAPVLIASAATAVKVSAAISLPIIMAVTLWRMRQELSRALRWLPLMLLPVFAIVVATFIETGCWLYPAPFSCAAVPWGFQAEQAQYHSGLIRNWYYYGAVYPKPMSFGAFVADWCARERPFALMLLVTASSVLTVLDLSVRRLRLRVRPTTLAFCSSAAVSLAGLAVCLYVGPSIRFAIGYVAIVPAMAACISWFAGPLVVAAAVPLLWFGWRGYQFSFPESLYWFTGAVLLAMLAYGLRARQVKAMTLSFTLVFCFIPYLLTASHFRTASEVLLLPETATVLPNNSITSDAKAGYELRSPAAPTHRMDSDVVVGRSQCWAEHLPCSYYSYDDVHLRDPAKGISAGFIRGPGPWPPAWPPPEVR